MRGGIEGKARGVRWQVQRRPSLNYPGWCSWQPGQEAGDLSSEPTNGAGSAKRNRIVILLLVLAMVPVVTGVWYVSPLYQKTKLFMASRQIDSFVQDGEPVSPPLGDVVHCRNGEWIIVTLHHGSRGFTMIRTSSGKKYAEVEYKPHPVIECWGGIISGKDGTGYESVEDFFRKNASIRWIKMN